MPIQQNTSFQVGSFAFSEPVRQKTISAFVSITQGSPNLNLLEAREGALLQYNLGCLTGFSAAV